MLIYLQTSIGYEKKMLQAILATIISSCLNWLVHRTLFNRRRLLAKGDEFRAPFVGCKQELGMSRNDPYKIIAPYLKRQELAVTKFARHLAARKRRRLMDAWHSYYCYDLSGKLPFPEKYFAAGSIDKAEGLRKDAHDKLGEILACAHAF
jgi:hypothetical protein